VGKAMDASAEDVKKNLEPYFSKFGQRKGARIERSISELLRSERFLNSKNPLTQVRKD
jgi:hypothetical protein